MPVKCPPPHHLVPRLRAKRRPGAVRDEPPLTHPPTAGEKKGHAAGGGHTTLFFFRLLRVINAAIDDLAVNLI